MVEAPTDLQSPGALTIPPQHLDACKSQNIPIAGNAAGNTVDLFDMTGANENIPPLPDGFTTRGIVALVFSCLAGLLGVAVIAWYGVGEISEMKTPKKMDVAGAVTAEGKEGEL